MRYLHLCPRWILLLVTLTAVAAVACGGGDAETVIETVIVEKEVVVEKEVIVEKAGPVVIATSIVEVEVTTVVEVTAAPSSRKTLKK